MCLIIKGKTERGGGCESSKRCTIVVNFSPIIIRASEFAVIKEGWIGLDWRWAWNPMIIVPFFVSLVFFWPQVMIAPRNRYYYPDSAEGLPG